MVSARLHVLLTPDLGLCSYIRQVRNLRQEEPFWLLAQIRVPHIKSDLYLAATPSYRQNGLDLLETLSESKASAVIGGSC